MPPISLAQASQAVSGTGLEWMPIASFVLPALVLALIFWLGSRNAV